MDLYTPSITSVSWDFTIFSDIDQPCNPRGKKLPYKKDGGARWKVWKEPLGGIKILSCGRGMNFFFTSKRYQIMGFN